MSAEHYAFVMDEEVARLLRDLVNNPNIVIPLAHARAGARLVAGVECAMQHFLVFPRADPS